MAFSFQNSFGREARAELSRGESLRGSFYRKLLQKYSCFFSLWQNCIF